MYPKFVDVTCQHVFLRSDSLVKITTEKSRERCYKKSTIPLFSFKMTFYKKEIGVSSFNDIFPFFAKQPGKKPKVLPGSFQWSVHRCRADYIRPANRNIPEAPPCDGSTVTVLEYIYVTSLFLQDYEISTKMIL